MCILLIKLGVNAHYEYNNIFNYILKTFGI